MSLNLLIDIINLVNIQTKQIRGSIDYYIK